MIASDETFLDKLEEKAARDLDGAIRVGQHLLDADRSVTQSLLYRVNAAESEADLDRANRLLSIVGTINQAVGNVMPLVPLTSAHDSRIRSKAMLLVGKVVRRSEWLKKALSDPDSRVRANAIEAVWGAISEDLVPLLERALDDEHPRVVGNAVVALIQIGSEGALDHLERMTEHTAAEFRATAAWAIGHLQQADLLPRIKMLLQDKDPLVFRNALRASVKLRKDRKEAAPGQA
jgi:HEAT repeat protein